jgi:hypothetical protein
MMPFLSNDQEGSAGKAYPTASQRRRRGTIRSCLPMGVAPLALVILMFLYPPLRFAASPRNLQGGLPC